MKLCVSSILVDSLDLIGNDSTHIDRKGKVLLGGFVALVMEDEEEEGWVIQSLCT